MQETIEMKKYALVEAEFEVCQMQFDYKLVHDVKSRLDAQGFKEWQEEEF